MITLHVIALILYIIASLGFGFLAWVYMESVPFVSFTTKETITGALVLTLFWPFVIIILFILSLIELIKNR